MEFVIESKLLTLENLSTIFKTDVPNAKCTIPKIYPSVLVVHVS